MMYCNNNQGRFPRPGVAQHPEDWIFWEDMPRGTNPNRNIDDSAIGPYLGKPVNPEVFRCPSDDVEVRRPGVNYRFSYSANYLILRLPPRGRDRDLWPRRIQPSRCVLTEIVSLPTRSC